MYKKLSLEELKVMDQISIESLAKNNESVIRILDQQLEIERKCNILFPNLTVECQNKDKTDFKKVYR